MKYSYPWAHSTSSTFDVFIYVFPIFCCTYLMHFNIFTVVLSEILFFFCFKLDFLTGYCWFREKLFLHILFKHWLIEYWIYWELALCRHCVRAQDTREQRAWPLLSWSTSKKGSKRRTYGCHTKSHTLARGDGKNTVRERWEPRRHQKGGGIQVGSDGRGKPARWVWREERPGRAKGPRNVCSHEPQGFQHHPVCKVPGQAGSDFRRHLKSEVLKFRRGCIWVLPSGKRFGSIW